MYYPFKHCNFLQDPLMSKDFLDELLPKVFVSDQNKQKKLKTFLKLKLVYR